MTTLRLQGIGKSYGPLRALDKVSVEFRPGEIHAVLGENGAGKSTLMNVLAGFVRPDQGQIFLGTTPLPIGDPLATRQAGIEMVHQHFMLVPDFTVAENFALAILGDLRGRLDLDKLTEPHRALASSLGWAVDLGARTGDLPVGVQQRVEILKALATDRPVLILDEPTAVLTPEEVEDLFRVLRQLRDKGKIVLLIAHKLSEIMAVADVATVLRQGRWVATSRVAESSVDELANWMVGEIQESRIVTDQPLGEALVVVKGLTVLGDRGETAVKGIDFSIRRGEILGIGGVDGNGQVELAEALVGIRPSSVDTMESPASVGYIPQDRQEDGLAMTMSIQDNLLITGHRDESLRRGPFLQLKRVVNWAREIVDQYKIKIAKLEDSVSSLSGGNQQKIVISRTLAAGTEFLVAVNPTRGLDFGATRFVYEAIQKAAENQSAVLLISTDRDELVQLAHRQMVISEGRLKEGSVRDAVVGQSP